MSSQLELFVLPWGLYPRRTLLYLREKGLEKCPVIKITPVSASPEGRMEAPGKPPGSVPILRLPNGTFIKQSIAILEYLEDVCDRPDPSQQWQVELAEHAVKDSMRGNTSEERARTREMLSLADEATSQFGLACHKGTALFVPIERTNALASNLILEYCKKNLKLLEDNYGDEFRIRAAGKVTIAHCVLYSVLQFADEMYGFDLTLSEPELPALRQFYKTYQQRDVSRLEEGFLPEGIKQLAQQWLPLE